jgi:hypothetical protein
MTEGKLYADYSVCGRQTEYQCPHIPSDSSTHHKTEGGSYVVSTTYGAHAAAPYNVKKVKTHFLHSQRFPSPCAATLVLGMSDGHENIALPSFAFQELEPSDKGTNVLTPVDDKQLDKTDLFEVVLDESDDPKHFPSWRKWVIIGVVSSAAAFVACASSMVRSHVSFPPALLVIYHLF